MKYFCGNAPQYHIACAGSLLGIALLREKKLAFSIDLIVAISFIIGEIKQAIKAGIGNSPIPVLFLLDEYSILDEIAIP